MINNNCLLFNALNKIRALNSSKVSMWSLEDNYSYVPFLRFRFKNTDFEDLIYVKLAETIRSYKGIVKWDITFNRERASNYFIFPEALKNYIFTLGFYREKLMSVFDEFEYKYLVDMSIKDIPQFALYIESIMLVK